MNGFQGISGDLDLAKFTKSMVLTSSKSLSWHGTCPVQGQL